MRPDDSLDKPIVENIVTVHCRIASASYHIAATVCDREDIEFLPAQNALKVFREEIVIMANDGGPDKATNGGQASDTVNLGNLVSVDFARGVQIRNSLCLRSCDGLTRDDPHANVHRDDGRDEDGDGESKNELRLNRFHDHILTAMSGRALRFSARAENARMR